MIALSSRTKSIAEFAINKGNESQPQHRGLAGEAFTSYPLSGGSVGGDQGKEPPEEDLLLIMDPRCQRLSSDALQS